MSKTKKRVRATKTAAQQIEDLKRAIGKYGDHDGKRTRQLEQLLARQEEKSCEPS
jgi:hypothetical protein